MRAQKRRLGSRTVKEVLHWIHSRPTIHSKQICEVFYERSFSKINKNYINNEGQNSAKLAILSREIKTIFGVFIIDKFCKINVIMYKVHVIIYE